MLLALHRWKAAASCLAPKLVSRLQMASWPLLVSWMWTFLSWASQDMGRPLCGEAPLDEAVLCLNVVWVFCAICFLLDCVSLHLTCLLNVNAQTTIGLGAAGPLNLAQ